MGITLSELFNFLPHHGLTQHLIQETYPPFISKVKPSINISPLYKPPSPLFSTALPSNALTNPNLSTKLKLSARDFAHRMDEPSVIKTRKYCCSMRDPWPITSKSDEHVPKKKVGNEKIFCTSPPSSPFLISSPTLLMRNVDNSMPYGTFFKVSCTMPCMVDLLPHDGNFAYPSFNDSFSTNEYSENLLKKQMKTDGQAPTSQPSSSSIIDKSMTMATNTSSKWIKSQGPRQEKYHSKMNHNTISDLTTSSLEKKTPIHAASFISTNNLSKPVRISSAKSQMKTQAAFPVSYPTLSPPTFPQHPASRPTNVKFLHLLSHGASTPLLTPVSKPVYLPLKSFSSSSPSVNSKTLSSSSTLHSPILKTKQTTLKLITRLYFPNHSRRGHPYDSNLQTMTSPSTKLPTLKKVTIT
ncbi:hypothetical protein HMI54_005317 [Coelomomyces lativittatus]|nr:hypothetical protein HMI56_003175 [Coelomomyces lativittatus]KAJ1516397.1 hypothetical protein HMI55_002371 [Coelomomyces lativittatus]KAJ1517507.1 hypothetical protein HMI54_005317 [Coelomomyces lativittatus]